MIRLVLVCSARVSVHFTLTDEMYHAVTNHSLTLYHLYHVQGNTALHFAYKKSSSSVITVLTRVDDGRIELIMNKVN